MKIFEKIKTFFERVIEITFICLGIIPFIIWDSFFRKAEVPVKKITRKVLVEKYGSNAFDITPFFEVNYNNVINGNCFKMYITNGNCFKMYFEKERFKELFANLTPDDVIEKQIKLRIDNKLYFSTNMKHQYIDYGDECVHQFNLRLK